MSDTVINPSKAIVAINEHVEDVPAFGSSAPGSLAGFQGELRPEYRRVPWISIIQGVGQNSRDFASNLGYLLYNREKVVPKPVNATFYGVRTQYQQNLPYDANAQAQPLVFETAIQVEEHGGNLRRGVRPGTDDNNFIPIARALLVLESPIKKGWANGVDLSITFEAKVLVPTAWFLKGVAFGRTVDILRMAAARLGKDNQPLHRARWSLDIVNQNINGNFVWVPVLTKLDETNTDNYLAAVPELFGE